MQNSSVKTSPKSVKELINSCDFLDQFDRAKWGEKVENLPESALKLVYKKFKDAKNNVESIYIGIAVGNKSTDMKLVGKFLDAIKQK